LSPSLFPFPYLHAFSSLLPLSELCAFWEPLKAAAASNKKWDDFCFEDDALDDSLSPSPGNDSDTYFTPPPTGMSPSFSEN
jgi:hypothetical protein